MKPFIITNNDVEEISKSPNYVLVFSLKTCPPCQKLKPVIDEIAEGFEDVAFGKVDGEMNLALARKYGIRSVPAIKFIQNGKEVGSLVGYRDAKTFLSEAKSIFKL